jgi:hypothetical protein
LALIAAASFAGYQIILQRQDRATEGAIQVLTQMQSIEFQKAYTKIWNLPLAATAHDIRDAGPEYEDAVEVVAMTFESLGVMVHNRLVPVDLVDQAIGGFLRESWRRTQPYIEWRRDQVGSRRLAEWYQWLAEHVAVDTRRSTGAYDAFRKWVR